MSDGIIVKRRISDFLKYYWVEFLLQVWFPGVIMSKSLLIEVLCDGTKILLLCSASQEAGGFQL